MIHTEATDHNWKLLVEVRDSPVSKKTLVLAAYCPDCDRDAVCEAVDFNQVLDAISKSQEWNPPKQAS